MLYQISSVMRHVFFPPNILINLDYPHKSRLLYIAELHKTHLDIWGHSRQGGGGGGE